MRSSKSVPRITVDWATIIFHLAAGQHFNSNTTDAPISARLFAVNLGLLGN